MANPQELTVLSLCTGYGGLELGLSRALENPLRVVAVEIEAYALANLVAKAEEGKLAIEALYPDLKTFPAERFSGCFDIILAGYPCQPFSVAGKRQGTDDPRHLWPHIAELIKAIRPVWCFFENVAGHLTLGFPEVYCSLRDMGYSVEAGLFTASECGAPHKRQRLFILANSASVDDRLRCRNEHGQDEAVEGRRAADGRDSQPDSSSNGTRWPARPGEPQYEWEEPRVTTVGDAKKQDKLKRGKCGVHAGQEANEERQANIDNTDGSSAMANPSQGRAGDHERTAGRGARREDVRQGDGAAGSVRADAAGELGNSQSKRCGETGEHNRRPPERTTGTSGELGDATTNKQRRSLQSGNDGQGFTAGGSGGKSGAKAQSGLGRAANGPGRQVDRLRLCGNGVVPQQAELAFRSLI